MNNGFKERGDAGAEKAVLDFLAEKSTELAADYHSYDGNVEACTLLAVDVARLLIKAGEVPRIVAFNGALLQGSKINTQPLRPTKYQGRVSWGSHVVCICDNLVYDPMIGRPVSVSEYAQEAFGGPIIQSHVVADESEVEDFVKE